MPGNKNSGQRKSHQINDLPDEIPVKKKRKPDRPKKMKTMITLLQKMLKLSHNILIENQKQKVRVILLPLKVPLNHAT